MPQLIAMVIVVVGAMIYMFQTFGGTGDKIEGIAHKTQLELSKNFITPFDREDINALIKSIDNVADNMHGAASRMRLYQVEKITKS